MTVQAAYSKHRREEVVPLRRNLAEEIATFIADRPPDGNLIKVPDKPAKMLRTDLTAARRLWLSEAVDEADLEKRGKSDFLCYRDHEGRVMDFHALRHSTGTLLAAADVHSEVIQNIMRHSTITMTMDHYTHMRVSDERAALDRLPSFDVAQDESEEVMATGTTDSDPVINGAARNVGTTQGSEQRVPRGLDMSSHASNDSSQDESSDVRGNAKTLQMSALSNDCQDMATSEGDGNRTRNLRIDSPML